MEAREIIDESRKKLGDSLFVTFYSAIKDVPSITDYIEQIVQSTAQANVYTTGELAKALGISITSVNKWIDQERILIPDLKNGFIPYKRDHENQHASIRDDWYVVYVRQGEKKKISSLIDSAQEEARQLYDTAITSEDEVLEKLKNNLFAAISENEIINLENKEWVSSDEKWLLDLYHLLKTKDPT